jgi:hypothetical protein
MPLTDTPLIALPKLIAEQTIRIVEDRAEGQDYPPNIVVSWWTGENTDVLIDSTERISDFGEMRQWGNFLRAELAEAIRRAMEVFATRAEQAIQQRDIFRKSGLEVKSEIAAAIRELAEQVKKCP